MTEPGRSALDSDDEAAWEKLCAVRLSVSRLQDYNLRACDVGSSAIGTRGVIYRIAANFPAVADIAGSHIDIALRQAETQPVEGGSTTG